MTTFVKNWCCLGFNRGLVCRIVFSGLHLMGGLQDHVSSTVTAF